MTVKVTQYGFGTTLLCAQEQAIERVTGALKEEGFGILTAIDVQKTLREKLRAESRPYTILGACNPPLAHRALQAEPEIGLLLPVTSWCTRPSPARWFPSWIRKQRSASRTI